MSSLGVFSDECSTFLDRMNGIDIDKKQQLYIIKKMINIAIRATYYIFCCRNRNWDSPDLMQFFFLFFFCFCFVLFCFDFWIIQSQAAFVNRLYVARFTIVNWKTQKRFHYYYYFVFFFLLLFFYGKDGNRLSFWSFWDQFQHSFNLPESNKI